MKRTALRPRSPQRERDMRLYRRQVPVFLIEHDTCEHPTNHQDHPVPSQVVHHRRGRRGRRLLDQRWWAGSCNDCNAEAEDDTGKSLACGWLVRIEGVA